FGSRISPFSTRFDKSSVRSILGCGSFGTGAVGPDVGLGMNFGGGFGAIANRQCTNEPHLEARHSRYRLRCCRTGKWFFSEGREPRQLALVSTKVVLSGVCR